MAMKSRNGEGSVNNFNVLLDPRNEDERRALDMSRRLAKERRRKPVIVGLMLFLEQFERETGTRLTEAGAISQLLMGRFANRSEAAALPPALKADESKPVIAVASSQKVDSTTIANNLKKSIGKLV
jgi:hypothetical protein